MKPIKKIAVLTGGGDCSGLNAVIRAITRTAITKYGWEVIGYIYGYAGLYENDWVPLTIESTSGILHQGGTILKNSNRDNLFNYMTKDATGKKVYKDVSDVAIANLKKESVDALVVIGGDGTLTSARDFARKGVSVIGVPKTIDNDLPATDITFGYDTALGVIVDALDRLHTTAFSHNRVMILEVMGRNSGWLALEGGLAGSADVILIPEIPYDINKVAEKIRARDAAGRLFSIIVVAEGAMPKGGEAVIREIVEGSPDAIRLGGIGNVVTQQLQKLTPEHEVRYTNLGYMQRGGSPTHVDRTLGTRLGVHAVDILAQGHEGNMVCVKNGKLSMVHIEDVVGRGPMGETSHGGAKVVDPNGEFVRIAKAIGVSFGD